MKVENHPELLESNLNLIKFGLTTKKFLLDENLKAFTRDEIFQCSILFQILVDKIV
jgi:hypothetical protein